MFCTFPCAFHNAFFIDCITGRTEKNFHQLIVASLMANREYCENCNDYTMIAKHDVEVKDRTNEKSGNIGIGVVVSISVVLQRDHSTVQFSPSDLSISSKLFIRYIKSIPSQVNFDSDEWDMKSFYLLLYFKPDKPIPPKMEEMWTTLLSKGSNGSVKVGAMYYTKSESVAIVRSKLLMVKNKPLKVFKCTIIGKLETLDEIASSKSRLVPSHEEPAAKKQKLENHKAISAVHSSDISNGKSGAEQLIASTHYNELVREQATRHLSLIYHLRKLNNYLKAELIDAALANAPQTISLSVIDFGAGKGGDISKWFRPSGYR